MAYLDNSTRSSDGDVDERADADGFVRPRSDTGAAHGNGDHGGALGAPRPLALHAPDELNGYLVSRRATTLGLRYHPWTVGSSWETLSALSLGPTRSPKGGNRRLAEFDPNAWHDFYEMHPCSYRWRWPCSPSRSVAGRRREGGVLTE